jgi:hypothetical protein
LDINTIPKQAGLVASVASANVLLGRIPSLVDRLTINDDNGGETLEEALATGIQLVASMALWGNQMDLSLWPADASHARQDIFTAILDRAHEHLLHDDSDALTEHCQRWHRQGGGQIDIIVDNAGFELVTDLALAQYLVQSGIAQRVTFQLKSHPTFVSDAQTKDLLGTIDYYLHTVDAKEYPHVHAAAQVWQSLIESGQWQCQEHSFWVQGRPMWDMPDALYADLSSRCDLAFVKGDANYRRLLGDLQWHMTEASFADVVGAYFPSPVCALRTLKAEIGCGMDAAAVQRAQATDDKWMVNGKYGVVHFGMGNSQKNNSSNSNAAFE